MHLNNVKIKMSVHFSLKTHCFHNKDQPGSHSVIIHNRTDYMVGKFVDFLISVFLDEIFRAIIFFSVCRYVENSNYGTLKMGSGDLTVARDREVGLAALIQQQYAATEGRLHGYKSPLKCGSPAARLLALRVRIPPGARIFVYRESRVLSRRGLCDEPIPRPEESYRARACH
jgi:hypothetical protein